MIEVFEVGGTGGNGGAGSGSGFFTALALFRSDLYRRNFGVGADEPGPSDEARIILRFFAMAMPSLGVS